MERKVKVNLNHNNSLNHLPPPEQEEPNKDVNNYYHNENYRGNNRGHRPYRGHYSGRKPYRGEGDNKTIIEANTKATADNLIPLMETIIITVMAIIEAEVVMAILETISDLVVTEEAIIEAIIITNITCMMMDHRLNNMAYHAHFVVVLIILLNIALKENMTSIISWRK